ncbi:WD40-repeat-containing domain protein [Melanogaster broomeanus]|nr:WD40-repeat-containing domain protein [Melanogaster broomeanus]
MGASGASETSSASLSETSPETNPKTSPVPSQILKNHCEVECVRFFPSGRKVLVGLFHSPHTAIWDLESGQEVARTSATFDKAHRLALLDVALSRDEKTVATSGNDETIRLWRFGETAGSGADGRRIATCVRYSPDGQLLAAAVDQIYLWKADSGETVREIQGTVSSLLWTPDGTCLVCGDQEVILVFDVDSGNQLRSLTMKPEYDGQGVPHRIRCLDISPDGSYVLAARRLRDDGILSMLDLKNGSVVTSLDHNVNRGIRDAAFSPSGDLIAVVLNFAPEVYIWPFGPENDDASTQKSRSSSASILDVRTRYSHHFTCGSCSRARVYPSFLPFLSPDGHRRLMWRMSKEVPLSM